MLKRRLLLLGIAAVAASAGFYAGKKRWQALPSVSEPAELLFSLVLADTEGRPQRLSQWRNQVLVVNFWGTWCPPCVEEMPDFEEVRRTYLGQEVEIIGLAIDHAPAVAEFASRLNITYPLLIAGAMGTELSKKLGNSAGGLPFTIVMDAKGQVRYLHSGRLKPGRLREMIDTSRLLSSK